LSTISLILFAALYSLGALTSTVYGIFTIAMVGGWIGFCGWTGLYIFVAYRYNKSRPHEHIQTGLPKDRIEKAISSYVEDVKERGRKSGSS